MIAVLGPQLDQGAHETADVVLCNRRRFDEDDAAMGDALLAPHFQQRHDGFRVVRDERETLSIGLHEDDGVVRSSIASLFSLDSSALDVLPMAQARGFFAVVLTPRYSGGVVGTGLRWGTPWPLLPALRLYTCS